MAKCNIQYVQFPTEGSSARKVMPALRTKLATLPAPKVKSKKRKVIFVDPVAGLGMIVAVAMLVMMCFGVAQLMVERHETKAMEAYLVTLSQQNNELEAKYTAGYELEDVERTALALGMVPREHVPNTVIHVVDSTQQVSSVSVWQRIGTVLSGLFA